MPRLFWSLKKYSWRNPLVLNKKNSLKHSRLRLSLEKYSLKKATPLLILEKILLKNSMPLLILEKLILKNSTTCYSLKNYFLQISHLCWSIKNISNIFLRVPPPQHCVTITRVTVIEMKLMNMVYLTFHTQALGNEEEAEELFL